MKCGIMWSHIVLVSLALWQIGSCISIDNCPDNLERNVNLKAFGDKCYFFHLYISREFNAAQDICRKKGGNLVSIKSAKMNSYLLDQLRNYYEYDGPIWIGLSDQADEKQFIWRDGSAMGYSNFESNAGPDTPWWDITNRFQDCIAMSPLSGEWEDLDCNDNFFNNHHHAFVCEYDPKRESPPTTTSTTTRTTTLLPTTANTTNTTLPPPPATTTAPAPPPTTTIASTATPTTLELTLPNEEGLMTTITPTTTKTTTAFIVPTSDAAPTTTSTPLPPPTTTSTPTSPPPTTTEKASSTSTPASIKDTSTAAVTCAPVVCSKDCGMLGFATDEKTGCMMCECQEK